MTSVHSKQHALASAPPHDLRGCGEHAALYATLCDGAFGVHSSAPTCEARDRAREQSAPREPRRPNPQTNTHKVHSCIAEVRTCGKPTRSPFTAAAAYGCRQLPAAVVGSAAPEPRRSGSGRLRACECANVRLAESRVGVGDAATGAEAAAAAPRAQPEGELSGCRAAVAHAPERRGLLEREEHAADRRAERRREPCRAAPSRAASPGSLRQYATVAADTQARCLMVLANTYMHIYISTSNRCDATLRRALRPPAARSSPSSAAAAVSPPPRSAVACGAARASPD
jgi:hypothetical protein